MSAALDEAKTIAANLRTAIVNGDYPPPPQTTEALAAPVTLRTAADRFLKAVPVLKGKNQGKPRGFNERQKLLAFCAWTPAGHSAPLGELEAGAVTEDVYEAFVQRLRDHGRAAGTVSKVHLSNCKALDRWLAKKGYRAAPAINGDSVVLRRTQATRRDRRLQPDTLDEQGKVAQEGEERRLIRAANPWLQRFIIGAIETGCRMGELLGVRWADLDLTRGEIAIVASSNKTGEGRRLPISSRLRSVLDLLRLDPAGKERPGHHYVFGDAIGQKVGSAKKAWEAPS